MRGPAATATTADEVDGDGLTFSTHHNRTPNHSQPPQAKLKPVESGPVRSPLRMAYTPADFAQDAV